MKTNQVIRRSLALMAGALCLSPPLWARDTDIYTFKAPQQNAYILLDQSGSMSVYVYDHNIDYGKMMEQAGIRDKYEKERLYLVRPFSGEPSASRNDPNLTIKKNPKTGEYYDETDDIDYDMHFTAYHKYFKSATKYKTDSALVGDDLKIGKYSDGEFKITQQDNEIRINGQTMPYNLNLKLHNYNTLADTGIVMDEGLVGMLKAPGYHATGFDSTKNKNDLTLSRVSEGSSVTYLLVTGNLINFSNVISSYYWSPRQSSSYKISSDDTLWPEQDYQLKYPASGTYIPNLTGVASMKKMDVVAVTSVKLRFKSLNLGTGDTLHIELEGREKGTDKDTGPVTITEKMKLQGPINETDRWITLTGLPGAFHQTLRFRLESNGDESVGTGYLVDKARTFDGKEYKLKSRLDVTKEAIEAIVRRYGNDINWGFYQYDSNVGAKHKKGEYIDLDPTAANSETHRDNLLRFMWDEIQAGGNTPTMMALQHIWLYGLYDNPKRDELAKDCKKTLIIHLSDGFPTNDTGRCKFKDYKQLPFPQQGADAGCFTDEDGDKQFNEFDDIATWIATHSWADYTDPQTGQSFKRGDEIPDPTKGNPKNAITHNIAFGARMALLKNASDEVKAKTGSGMYLIASNKGQLVAAFSAMITGQASSVSFSSPTISTSSENLLESGYDMYMPLFQPIADGPWLGNLKKYKRGGDENAPARPDPTKIYGEDNKETTSVEARDFWVNDSTIAGANSAVEQVKKYCPEIKLEGGITSGGVGTIMLYNVCQYFHGGKGQQPIYWKRPIYFFKGDRAASIAAKDAPLTPFTPDSFTNEADWKLLGQTDASESNRIINYVHGYTREVSADNSVSPQAPRSWPMGPILHSLPVTFDKTISEDGAPESRRRIVVVGSSFGMLHFFLDGKYMTIKEEEDENDPNKKKKIYSDYSDDPALLNKGGIELGRELFSFIPPTAMEKLMDMGQPGYQDATDGLITLYREAPKDAPHGEKEVKYVIFGERRGGNTYYCLDVQSPDPKEWKLKWSYRPDELGQSWSSVQIAAIRTAMDPKRDDFPSGPEGSKQFNAAAEAVWKNVIIFSGGYDEQEDNFPEPFEDVQANGSPFVNPQGADANLLQDFQPVPPGVLPTKYEDKNLNNRYDWKNPNNNTKGRGIFVALLDDPNKTVETKGGGAHPGTHTILPFSVIYGTGTLKTGNVQTRDDMKYCFPASPSVLTEPVTRTVHYPYKDAAGTERQGRKQVLINALRAIYAVDVYANVYKVEPLRETNSTVDQLTRTDLPVYDWSVRKLFSANPGIAGAERTDGEGAPEEQRNGRKAFYSPTISLGGTAGSFQASNFRQNKDLTFAGTDNMASIFFGTGDREHPKSAMIKNRIYAVYDDSDIWAGLGGKIKLGDGSIMNHWWGEGEGRNDGGRPVSTAPYTEKNLLNLTCTDLKVYQTTYQKDTPAEVQEKQTWQDLLVDDFLENKGTDPLQPFEINIGVTLVPGSTPPEIDTITSVGAVSTIKEDDRKGWFIMLDEQGKCTKDNFAKVDPNVEPAKGGGPINVHKTDIDDADNHFGEQVLSKPLLYNGNLYFTSYQNKTSGDHCVGMSSGNGFVYALDYQNGSATYEWPRTNKIVSYTGRSVKYTNIGGIPSGFSLIFQGRQVMAVASVGKDLKGAGKWEGSESDSTAGAPGFPIDTPPLGLKQYYWFDQNSQARETQDD